MLKTIRTLALAFCFCLALSAAADAQEAGRQHLVFFRDTPQELVVYKIRGRAAGPTAMLLGGIHGDEPGAYLSADLYADLTPRRGNLIIVPRANFRAVLHGQRGPGGDMNRKFGASAPDDPENQVIAVLKRLMAESDLLITLHDGSGFYRPEWTSELANPNRYGQCVITDTAEYTHPGSGTAIPLKTPALKAIARVNEDIADPLHKFHYFNMETADDESLYKEHRDSATYFALTKLGIPAFCIETSKNLPDMGMKIRQHNLVVNAFLQLYGIELEVPGLRPVKPEFSHLVVRVDGRLPLAVANGQTLQVRGGSDIEVLHAAASVERGLLVTARGNGFNSILQTIMRVERPFTIEVRRDNHTLGQVGVDLLPPGAGDGPMVSGAPAGPYAAFARAGIPTDPASLPGSRLLARLEGETPPAAPPAAAKSPYGRVTAFLVEVDGTPAAIPPGGELAVPQGSRLKIVDLQTEDGPLPKGTVMNLKGFVAKGNESGNTGEDRGCTANLARDMMRTYSEGGKGEVYAINAEQGKKILAACAVRIVPPAPARQDDPGSLAKGKSAPSDQGGPVTGFLLEVDGRPVEIAPGGQLDVLHGSVLKIVDLKTGGAPLPKGMVMNLKGFIARGDTEANAGEDRGSVVRVPGDMMRNHSESGKGEVYAINAELGKQVFAACSVRLVKPVLESATVRFGEKTMVLRPGTRTPFAPGSKIELLEVALKGGHRLGVPRFTLAGHPFSANLPRTLTMRDIAINLAVFNGDVLAGKITWVPAKAD